MHELGEEHYQESMKLQGEGRYELARRNFLKTLELQPDRSGALSTLKPRKRTSIKKIVIHTIKRYWYRKRKNIWNKEYKAAIAEFDKVLNVNPDDKITIAYLSNTYFQQGIILFEKEDYLEAEKNSKHLIDTIRTVRNARNILIKAKRLVRKHTTKVACHTLGNNNYPKLLRNGN